MALPMPRSLAPMPMPARQRVGAPAAPRTAALPASLSSARVAPPRRRACVVARAGGDAAPHTGGESQAAKAAPNNGSGGASASSSLATTSTVSLGDFVRDKLGDGVRAARKSRRKALRQARRGGDLPEDSVRLVRLAMRRLRNAVRSSGVVFELPRRASARALSPAVQALSAPRDAEAMATTLRDAAKSTALRRRERRALRAALAELAQQRADAFAHATAALQRKQLRAALRALRAAAAAPAPRAPAAQPALDGAARLLGTTAYAVLRHDAWGLDALQPPTPPAQQRDGNGAPWERVLHVDAARCAVLHDLRKAIRELRYSMELFQPLYDSTANADADAAAKLYAQQLARLVGLQVAIGTMHDVEVVLQAKPRLTRCGALVAALRAAHDEAWHAFAEGRDALLAPQGRAALTAALVAAGASSGGAT